MRKTVIYNTGETIRFPLLEPERVCHIQKSAPPRYDWACMQKHRRFRIEKGQKHVEP